MAGFFCICRFSKVLLNFAKLSFNFNFNLVESWDSFILNFSNHSTPPHPTHPKKYKGPTLLNWAMLFYT